MNNYYDGRYANFSGRPYYVIAGSAEEAKQTVLDNADHILKDILLKKLPSGRKVLPKMYAMAIVDSNIRKIDNESALTTWKPRPFVTPDGVMMIHVKSGKIVVDIEQEG
jgi:hypothetical protein